MRGRKRRAYGKLERKLFLQVAVIALAALFAVLILVLLARGYVGELLVEALVRVFGMTRNRALFIHDTYVRGNQTYLLMGALAVAFLVLSRFLLSRFAKYFGEISDSLDILVEDRPGEIALSPELAAMERKIKAIKGTLDEREQTARLAEQRKNDLVMYLAHDIKTPLTSVIGYLSLLDEMPDMPTEQRAKYIGITLDKAYRLERLVDEFFEITRYRFGAQTLQKEHIDLACLFAQLMDELYPLLVDSGKTARVDVADDLTLYGDPNKLARAFHNMLRNAAAYGAEQSVIAVAAAETSDGVRVTITNDGTIPADKLSAIFDKFYRLDAARSTASGGAGLGLAIAKEIVTAHGGRIDAQSGGGKTTFTVELPRN